MKALDERVTSIVDGLYRADEDGQNQVSRLLATLSQRAHLDDRVQSAILGTRRYRSSGRIDRRLAGRGTEEAGGNGRAGACDRAHRVSGRR